jgi:hypothetical protein
VGFQPRALILWTDGSATSADTWTASRRMSIGFAARDASDVITVGSCSAADQDGVNPSTQGNRVAVKALTICQWGAATDSECDLTSFGMDGFTLNWTTNSANAYIINYMALGGDNFTNATVDASLVLDRSEGEHGQNGAFTPIEVLRARERLCYVF